MKKVLLSLLVMVLALTVSAGNIEIKKEDLGISGTAYQDFTFTKSGIQFQAKQVISTGQIKVKSTGASGAQFWNLDPISNIKKVTLSFDLSTFGTWYMKVDKSASISGVATTSDIKGEVSGKTITFTVPDDTEADYFHINLTATGSGAVKFTTLTIEYSDGGGSGNDDLQDAGMSFPQASYSVNLGDDFETPVLTKATTADVTYTSSNTAVATVDATTGEVTIVNAGETTITASAPANDDYKAGSASYTLNVKNTNVEVYDLVTSANDIVPLGQYVLIGYNSTKKEYKGMAGVSSTTKYRDIEDVTIADNVYEKTSQTIAPIVLEPTTGGYLINVDGNKYLQVPSGTSNELYTVSEAPSVFSLSLQSGNLVEIKSGSRYVRFNFSSPRVTTYSSGQTNGSLYILPGTGLYAPVITVDENNMVTIAHNTKGDQNAKIYYTVDNAGETEYTGAFEPTGVGPVDIEAYIKNEAGVKSNLAKVTVTVADHRQAVTLAFDPAEATINKGETIALNLTVSAAEGELDEAALAASKALVEYTITPAGIAEFTEDGSVKGLAHGNCTITAKIPENDAYAFRPATATFALSVLDPDLPIYKLVTDLQDIVPGGEYVLIAKNNDKFYGMTTQGGTAKTPVRLADDVTDAVSNNEFILLNNQVATIIPEKATDGKFKLKVSDGYLKIVSSDATSVSTVSAEENPSEFTITITDGLANILDGRYLRFNPTTTPVSVRAYNGNPSATAVNGSFYKLPGTGLYAPVISNEGNVVTISLKDEGDPNAEIYYTLSGDDETVYAYTVPFTVEDVGTVVTAYTKSGDYTSASVSETITYVKSTFSSLAKLFAQAADESEVTLNFSLTVLYQNGEYLYVKDAEKYVLIKGATAATYENGNVIAERSTVTVSKKDNIVTLAPLSLAAATEGEAVEPEEHEAPITKNDNASYLILDGVNIVMTDELNGTLKRGSRTIAVYNPFGLVIESENHLTAEGFVNVTEEGVLQFLPNKVYVKEGNRIPGVVSFSVETDEIDYKQGTYEQFDLGTKLTFSAPFATSYSVVYGDESGAVTKEGSEFDYVARDYSENGQTLVITPLNNVVEENEKVSYTFIIKAVSVLPEINVEYEEVIVEEDGFTEYSVKRGTVVTVSTDKNATVFCIVEDEESPEDTENSYSFSVEKDCEILANLIFKDENDSPIYGDAIVASFKVHIPTTELLLLNTNRYGLESESVTDKNLGNRTLSNTGGECNYTVNAGTRMLSTGLRFYPANYNGYTQLSENGRITVKAPVGYVIDSLYTGTVGVASDNGFKKSTKDVQSYFNYTVHHGRNEASITFNGTKVDNTGKPTYHDVPRIKVWLSKIVAPEGEISTDPAEAIIEKIPAGGYRVSIKMPADCHLYYHHNSVSGASFGPARVVDHGDFEVANVGDNDVHTFEVPSEGQVTYYGYHSATDTKGTEQPLMVSDEFVTTGVDNILIDSAEEGVYYNLQGLRVENPGAGVYIRVVNGQAVKVVL